MPAVFLPLAVLRVLGGLGLLGGVGAFGYYGSALWALPVLALTFTISFGLGKWRAWAHAARNGTLGKAIIGQAGTYAVQLVLVSILYFIGRGIGSMAGFEEARSTLAQSDWMWLGLFAAFAVAVGVGIVLLDLRARADAAGAVSPAGVFASADGPDLDPAPLTPQTFWTAHHHSNTDRPDDAAQKPVPHPDRAFLDEAGITAQEARLGVTLPAALRALYRMQNGGSLMSLYVPCPQDMNNTEEGWINPFSGYDDMTPLTRVETLRERISAYAYEDETEMFPPGSASMIVLAQWYRETLFLDYRGREAPRVGFADFDQFEDLSTGEWEQDALWWDDFDAFFAELRRQNPQ